VGMWSRTAVNKVYFRFEIFVFVLKTYFFFLFKKSNEIGDFLTNRQCPFKGLFNDTTLMQIQSGRTVPLIEFQVEAPFFSVVFA
jgi:hypothetical protein